MTKANNFIFTALHIVAWIIFVGLCIQAGALLVNFVFSYIRPEAVDQLYNKMDLSGLYHQNKTIYGVAYGCTLLLVLLKPVLFYVVIQLLLKLDLQKPFNSFVAQKISRISQITFAIGILSLIGRGIITKFADQNYQVLPLLPFWADSQAYILLGAVLFIIAAIFRRGVDLQEENDLTV